MPFYLHYMENYYNNCVNASKHLHEYNLHSTASLLAAEELGILPPEWSVKINEIFDSFVPLITAPADFDEVACWGFARIAAERCGHSRFLDRVKAESDGILKKMCRNQTGMLSMSGWPEDPLFFKRKDSIFFGSTRATTCWRELNLNEQLHYFGAAFPVLSMATNDRRFLDEAVKLLDHIDKIHRDPADGLLRHASRDGKAVGEKWGRGVTHALLGAFYMLELAPDLPEDIRQKAISFIDRTGDGLLKVQTEYGLWRNILDHAETAEETSCSVLIAWIFAHGVRKGYFERSKYFAMLVRAGNALKSRFWRGMGCANCRATYPGPNIQFYVRRPLHMFFLPLAVPALIEIDELQKNKMS